MIHVAHTPSSRSIDDVSFFFFLQRYEYGYDQDLISSGNFIPSFRTLPLRPIFASGADSREFTFYPLFILFSR